MKGLEQIEMLRKEIDECDKSLIKTFERRMELVMEILDYKRQNKLPILHSQREGEIIERALGSLNEKEFVEEVECFLNEILRMSRKLQSKKLFPYNIILIGFMGVGKSTVAKKLAKALEMKTVDSDTIIEEKMGMSITDIFKKNGESFFRKIEKDVIKDLSALNNTIISCGGGVVLDKENIINLRRNGKVILLQAEPKTIYERLKQDNSRPVLQGSKSLEGIEKLLDERKIAYDSSADIIIKTDNQSVEEISTKIIKRLYEMDEY